jgi:hypothetical protein
MVVIGLWIRLGILETPIFQQVLAEGRVARAPVVEVFKRQPKEIFLTAFARMAQMAPFFVYSVFVFPYGLQVVHLPRDLILLALLIGSFMSFFTIPLWGFLSDRLGRKRVYIFGAIATGLFAFAYFARLSEWGEKDRMASCCRAANGAVGMQRSSSPTLKREYFAQPSFVSKNLTGASDWKGASSTQSCSATVMGRICPKCCGRAGRPFGSQSAPSVGQPVRQPMVASRWQ